MNIKETIEKELSKEEYFAIWAAEFYRAKKGLSGKDAAEFFEKTGIYQMLADNYFLYHIESADNFIKDIDSKNPS